MYLDSHDDLQQPADVAASPLQPSTVSRPKKSIMRQPTPFSLALARFIKKGTPAARTHTLQRLRPKSIVLLREHPTEGVNHVHLNFAGLSPGAACSWVLGKWHIRRRVAHLVKAGGSGPALSEEGLGFADLQSERHPAKLTRERRAAGKEPCTSPGYCTSLPLTMASLSELLGLQA